MEEMLRKQPFFCSEPGYVHLRQGWVREDILATIEAYNGRWEDVRQFCCNHLQDEDVTVVANALTCLFVVGIPDDVSLVEPLLTHPDESVRKAAQTCLFEIRRHGG